MSNDFKASASNKVRAKAVSFSSRARNRLAGCSYVGSDAICAGYGLNWLTESVIKAQLLAIKHPPGRIASPKSDISVPYVVAGRGCPTKVLGQQ